MIAVTLLSEAGCELCDHARSVLERLGLEYPLEIRNVDLGTPEGQTLAQRGGIMFPPGLFVGHEPFSYGRVSMRRLRRELDRVLATVR